MPIASPAPVFASHRKGFSVAKIHDRRLPFIGSSLGLGFLALTTGLSPRPCNALDLEESRGVNLTLEEGYGARHRAQGLEFGGWQVGADAVSLSPAGMNDVADFTFSTSHSERFGLANFDHFAFLTPISATSTLGIGISRFGVSGIEWHSLEDVDPNHPETFSVADYAFATAYGRRLGPWDFGGLLQTVYRSMDQTGLGMRGDLMAAYSTQGLRAALLWKGALPSSARWESGYAEYAPSDLFLSLGIRDEAPYFYGRYQLVWESPGLFQIEARNAYRETRQRAWEDPIMALRDSKLGAEFAFDFGLALRVGLSGLPESGLPEPRLGAGYHYRGWLGFDYAFVPHAALGASHYVSLSWTPVFPRFSGKNLRAGFRSESRSPLSGQPSGDAAEDAPSAKPVPEAPSESPTPVVPVEEVLED